jgi:hypothetical protein
VCHLSGEGGDFRYNRAMKAFPSPYLCSEAGSFAENTLLVRLPEIARRVIVENQFSTEINTRIEALIAEMPDTPIRQIDDAGAPDEALWRGYLDRSPLTWRELSFFCCENYFYRRVLEASGYFKEGFTHALDPYQGQKQLGLETSDKGIRVLAKRLEAWRCEDTGLVQALTEAVESNLWGNRADLSLWPAGAEGTLENTNLHQPEEFLVVNQIPDLVAHLTGLRSQSEESMVRIDFLIDNAGFELVCDLMLADLLIGRKVASGVRFHLKMHPTFVSDALAEDVVKTTAFLCQHENDAVKRFGERIDEALKSGRLTLEGNYFWNSPRLDWEMDADLRVELREAVLVLTKGDAHYRRLSGDLHWEETTPFNDVTDYFPTSICALRTCKSEVIVGLPDGRKEELDRIEKDWKTNGRWGIVQFHQKGHL